MATRRERHGGMYTEVKRIVNGEVKQTACCCDQPGYSSRFCSDNREHPIKTACRCNCHRDKCGPEESKP